MVTTKISHHQHDEAYDKTAIEARTRIRREEVMKSVKMLKTTLVLSENTLAQLKALGEESGNNETYDSLVLKLIRFWRDGGQRR